MVVSVDPGASAPPSIRRGHRSAFRTVTGRRPEHRQDAGLDRSWQAGPSVDNGLQVGVIVRVFRFNCPRICPCVVRNVRFSWGFWALASVYGTDALSKRICLSQFGLVVATKILERRRIRAQVAQTGVCLSVTGVLLRDVFKILDGPIGVPD